MSYIDNVYKVMEQRDPSQSEFHQAVREVLDSLLPVLEQHPEYQDALLLERMIEPERVIQFRVPWVDDEGAIQVNRGFRVEMNGAIGPYKGGLRFHPSVNLSILKFLAFEQVFKNALTTLPMGGGKGGSDFNPRGRSDAEVMRFCQSFMQELYRHIGENTDVPAGDIGVGGREIGYLFGMYRKLTNTFTGVLTGKGLSWGGSRIRPEATGYGLLYFTREALATKDESLEGKTCLISGSGNVAQFACEKAIQMGAKVLTLSDSSGFIHVPDGVNEEMLAWVKELKNERRGRIQEVAEKFSSVEYHEAKSNRDCNPLWTIPADIALPSATQNEINGKDAENLLNNKVFAVCEGSNMSSTSEAIERFLDAGILYTPGKASNAGGVATSGLEMTQNSMRLLWTREEVDQKLDEIMCKIHQTCAQTADEYGKTGNYVFGANAAGFQKVADAMLAQGIV